MFKEIIKESRYGPEAKCKEQGEGIAGFIERYFLLKKYIGQID
jgi:hypothetical protein